MMQHVKYLLVVLAILLPRPVFSNDVDDPGRMRLSLIQGDVQVMMKDDTEWTPATSNLPLGEDDRLWVPEDARAEVQIRGGVYIRSDDKTSLDILAMSADAGQFYLDRGHIYINNLRGGIKTIQVDTPLSSVWCYDNSIVMLDVSEDGVTEVSVLKGYAYAESRAGATRVSAGNTLTVRSETNAELAPVGVPDDWERWNLDRDKRFTAWSESSRYLPDELHEYSSDFDDNGRWIYAGSYGYVWGPSVMATSWAPYTFGQWVWVRRNYVWIDYNPWGWAPFHYGRWAFIAGHGWCWVPPAYGAAYWGPGYVGWIVTPGYVAWVPLAPGEVYYGYGYYGPNSVNITTVNINTVVINRTYVNARVQNSVVVVKRDTFGTGRRDPVKPRENPFLDQKQYTVNSLGMIPPHTRREMPVVIAPNDAGGPIQHHPPPNELERKSNMTREEEHPALSTPSDARSEQPSADTFAQRSAEKQSPPERVRTNRPEKLKTDRKLVRERNASVFKAEPPQNLPFKQMAEPRTIKRRSDQPRQSSQPKILKKQKDGRDREED